MHFTTRLLLLAQLALGAVAVKHGTIGMGITMYKPVCAYACYDSLSALWLNCTTFASASDDMAGMEGMDMKLLKRMDMGEEPEATTSMECVASNMPWLQTLAYCLKDRCGIDGVGENKIAKAYSTLSMSDTAVYSEMLPAEAPTTMLEADAMWLNETSLVNYDMYFSNRQTLQEFEYQEDTHVQLSVALVAITVGVALLAGMYMKFSSKSLGNLTPVGVSKFLLLPALFNGKHQAPLAGNIGYAPSRLLSLVIFVYTFLNLIFSCVPYKSVFPQTSSAWFSDSKTEISTYVTNRTGVLSFANIAISILFAGRNNPLIWVTGLSQTTCLAFHRWAARVATVQAVVHSIIYTYLDFWSGGSAKYYANVKLPYYWWGIIGTIFLCLAITFSILPIRRFQYEIFLVTHIIMVIIALVGCWYHVVLRFTYNWGYEVWLYIAFAIWGFERLSRMAIVVYRNMVGGTATQAVAELTPGGTFMKITVYPSKGWNFKPGQHAFLYFPSTGRFWENHPFSIAGWDSGSTTSMSTSNTNVQHESGVVSHKDVEKDLQISTAPLDSDSTSSQAASHSLPSTHTVRAQHHASLSRPSITFLIRPMKGLTSSVHRDLTPTPNELTYLSLTLEGPYGHAIDLSHADSILCIGGGIGITALLSYVQFFVEARRTASSSIKASRLVLAWSYREREFASIVRSMLPVDARALGVEFLWTCTGSDAGVKGEEGVGVGRLNIGAVLTEEVGSVKRLAVLVCAPGGLADGVRREVVRLHGEGGRGLICMRILLLGRFLYELARF
ncbi:ferric reductase like transmembrane component-domain-containing protein [Rhexocercosporidium sp. MPI-PUGE-AT-0058]|nr:ferric reductase like transmembrane component-domain-containing protein [Rhexocercosporidium sp. MPI-PUGE-AT-0058]